MRGRKGTGVQLRKHGIRVRFTWDGKRHELALDLEPTIANKRMAERLMDKVHAAIDRGDFAFKDFPDLPQPEPIEPPKIATFGEYGKLWQESRGHLSAAQRDKDRLALIFWAPKVGGLDVDPASVKPSALEAMVGKIKWKGASYRNNQVAALRGIFEMWVKDNRRARTNPAGEIGWATRVKTRPDPFDFDAVELILADLAKHYDERVECYYGAAFFAGFRPEEEIVLRWSKIDDATRTALVDVAKHRGEEKATKNYEVRLVEFNDRAWAYVQRMRKWTAMKKHGCVFENPRTGEPWASEADQRDLYWTPALKRLRLRHRRAYVTRSTCATMMLAAGQDPAYCARQLGHSLRVFWEKYADWINGPRNAEERAKMNAALARAAERRSVA